MRDFDETGRKLCRMQGEVFAQSAVHMACSSAVFLRRFLCSAVARRMDQGGFPFEACDISAILGEVEEEFGPTDYGSEKYGTEELYWMGYLYRYWCYTQEQSSKQAYKIIKPKELRSLYYPYHSLDPAQAVERILEAKGVAVRDYTKEGVQILRRIINQREKESREAKESKP